MDLHFSITQPEYGIMDDEANVLFSSSWY